MINIGQAYIHAYRTVHQHFTTKKSTQHRDTVDLTPLLKVLRFFRQEASIVEGKFRFVSLGLERSRDHVEDLGRGTSMAVCEQARTE